MEIQKFDSTELEMRLTGIAELVRGVVGPKREISIWLLYGYKSGVKKKDPEGSFYIANETRVDIHIDGLTYERRTGATVNEMLVEIQKAIDAEQRIQSRAAAMAALIEDLDDTAASDVLSRVRTIVWARTQGGTL
jgi:hypothetical protein